jgi:hypothetical protein
MPHIFQLVLTHAQKKSNLLINQYIFQIDELARIISTSAAVNIIGCRCPSYPKSRFFYIVLVMQFIIKNIDVIHDYTKNVLNLEDVHLVENTLSIILSLLKLFTPMFSTLTYFEGDNVCLSEVFPILRHFFKHMKQIISEIQNPKIRDVGIFMCTDLYAHSLYSDYNLYYLSSYSLTKYGREEERLRQKIIGEISQELSGKELDYNFPEISEFCISSEQETHSEEEEEINLVSVKDIEFLPRNSEYSKEIKKRERSQRLLNKGRIIQRVSESDLFFFLFFNYKLEKFFLLIH